MTYAIPPKIAILLLGFEYICLALVGIIKVSLAPLMAGVNAESPAFGWCYIGI